MENSELITKALNYIKSENRKSDITIDDVATHAGFSTDYFNRIFFAHTGFNITALPKLASKYPLKLRKSTIICGLYYIFEFRYDNRTTKAAP